MAGLATAAFLANAQGLPAYYPPGFDQTGIVNGASRGQLIIDASAFSVDSNVRVHTPDTEFGSMGSVGNGTEIGFNIKNRPNGGKQITEIWVLPEGTVVLP
jgi:hypothetical protein